MRHPVTIQEAVESTNGVGETVETWTTLDEVWASIEPISGREFQAVQQIAAETTHKVTIRYLAGVTPKHRVLFGSRVFDILAVRNVEEVGRITDLLCRERV
jgi:SPP1 family predicted phage head-tail adaptor